MIEVAIMVPAPITAIYISYHTWFKTRLSSMMIGFEFYFFITLAFWYFMFRFLLIFIPLWILFLLLIQNNAALAQKTLYSVLSPLAHLINDLMQSVIPAAYRFLKKTLVWILPKLLITFVYQLTASLLQNL
jgi:hypothetical protein